MTYYCDRCLSEHESPDFVCVECEGGPMNPKKFRKKPVTIEAMRWDGSAEGATPIIDWVLDGGGTARYSDPQPETRMKGKVVREAVPALLSIDTLEGVMRAIPGDWIIRGVQGEFYPCKPDIFAATYEPAEETR